MTIQGQINDLIALRASQWVDILEDGKPEDHEEFVKWISESPRHLDAFLSTALLDRQLQMLDLPAEFDRDALLAHLSSPKVTQLRPVAVAQSAPAAQPVRAGKWKRWGIALAASVVVALAGIGVARFALTQGIEFETATGEQRAIQLTDGSLVHLNAESRLEVRFDEHAREIHLSEGEALFKVAKDAQRPFRVFTRNTVVEAVGTEFNVYARAAQTRVSVIEGRVNVTDERESTFILPIPMAEPGKPRITESLGAGEELQISRSGETIKLTLGNEISDAVSWQQRRRNFVKWPLQDIVAELNRYSNSVQLRLENVEPGSRMFTFSGTFDLDDPESLVAVLAREPDLQIERRGSEIIVRGVTHVEERGSAGSAQ